MLEPSTDILMLFIVASSPKQSLSWRHEANMMNEFLMRFGRVTLASSPKQPLSWRHEANMMNEFLMRFGRVTLATWKGKGKGKRNDDDQTSPHNYLRQS